jgi:large repetitive protein
MAQDGTAITWSPRSNVTLYGDTAVVTQAARLGVLISLGTDWVVTGSMNMTRELVCADELNKTYYDNFFTDEDLWLMATANAAAVTATDDVIGVLAPNKVADIAIFNGATHLLHRAVIDAQAQDTILVMRGGKVLYGDAALVSAISAGCDTLDVCGESKQLCAQSEIGKSFSALATANANLYPAFFCGLPDNEPSCLPSRLNVTGFPNVVVNGSNQYSGIPSTTDNDGDGIPNTTDNCVDVFNPIRPVDNGIQADLDLDSAGDACDVCPTDANTTVCTVFNPNDNDLDGINNAVDNCPNDANADQADADIDGKGNVCDACPYISNPGNQACPSLAATIYQIKNGTIALDTAVLVTDALVTGKAANGFFVQVKETDAGYQGPNFSGLFVFSGNSTLDDAVVVGNRISIDGTTTSFQGQIEITNPTSITITNAGIEAPPAPIVATVAQVTTGGSLANQLESVIVEVANATVTLPFNAFGEYEITDATAAKMLVDDFLFLSTNPTIGDFFLVTRGVLALRTIGGGQSASKIHPRSAADLIPGIALVSFAPTGGFLNNGDVGQTTFPTPLTASLNLPAAADTFVTITSSDPALVVVEGGGVTILAGQTSAPVILTALAVGTVTLTATSGTVSLTAEVSVVDPAQVPTLTTLSPPTSTIAAGGSVTFTVSLDLPAQGDTVVTLALNPAGAGTIPATVTIPDGQTSALFGYTDNGTVIGPLIQVSATLGATTLTANITAVAFVGTPHFSEYIEGNGGTNKAVEIVNPLATPFDMAANTCSVRLYTNGAAAPSQTVNLTGSIAAGDVFVLCNSQSVAAILAQCDLQNNQTMNFNGDDGVELFCNGATVDFIGQKGVDPGVEFGVQPNSTLNQTLIRKCSVIDGDDVFTDVFDPAVEWSSIGENNFADIGLASCAP